MAVAGAYESGALFAGGAVVMSPEPGPTGELAVAGKPAGRARVALAVHAAEPLESRSVAAVVAAADELADKQPGTAAERPQGSIARRAAGRFGAVAAGRLAKAEAGNSAEVEPC